MKVRVKKRFQDKYNPKRIYKVGEEIEVTEKRFAEILTKGELVEKIAEEPEEEPIEESAEEPAESKKKTTKKATNKA